MSDEDRFERVPTGHRETARGIERATGTPVVFLRTSSPLNFLDRAAERSVSAFVRASGDPRVSRIVADDPLAVEDDPIAREAKHALDIAADAALELLTLFIELGPRGIGVASHLAYVPRDRRAKICVPAEPALSLHEWKNPRRFDLYAVQWWASQAGVPKGPDGKSPRAIGEHFARFVTDGAARAAALPETLAPARAPLIDFDAAIAEGEAITTTLAAMPDRQREHARPFVAWGLAAALHHRACVRRTADDRLGARADLVRAIELDAHARFLTTRAFWDETDGEDDAAHASHDAAVAALDPLPSDHFASLENDPPDRIRADRARTFLARGAFRARRGEIALAQADVAASLAAAPSDRARRWAAFLARRA